MSFHSEHICSDIHEITTGKSKVTRGISFFTKAIHQMIKGFSVFWRGISETVTDIFEMTGVICKIDKGIVV